MKLFATWMLTLILSFGMLSGAYHLYLNNNPRKILVVVDSSFAMQPVWHRIPPLLEQIDRRRYSVYGLITEKSRIHVWKDRLNFGKVSPYAPRNFSGLNEAKYPEIEDASEIYLLTNAEAAQLHDFKGWRVLQP
jgi:hypothetical protein